MRRMRPHLNGVYKSAKRFKKRCSRTREFRCITFCRASAKDEVPLQRHAVGDRHATLHCVDYPCSWKGVQGVIELLPICKFHDAFHCSVVHHRLVVRQEHGVRLYGL